MTTPVPSSNDQPIPEPTAELSQPVLDKVGEPTTPSADLLSAQIVIALKSLSTLTLVALPNGGVSSEVRRQLTSLAQNLVALAQLSQATLEGQPSLALAWEQLSTQLEELLPEESGDPDRLLSEDDLARRLSLTIPPDLALMSESQTTVPSHNPARRVVIASLETDDSVGAYLSQATASFPAEGWSLTNLGGRLPIMALTSIVMELRPSVLALVLGNGQLVAETIRLIADLKRQLYGLRVMALGPALGSHPNLAERLRADLYSTDPTKAWELAEQFFSPLTRLGNRLNFNVEVEEQTEGNFEAEPEK